MKSEEIEDLLVKELTRRVFWDIDHGSIGCYLDEQIGGDVKLRFVLGFYSLRSLNPRDSLKINYYILN